MSELVRIGRAAAAALALAIATILLAPAANGQGLDQAAIQQAYHRSFGYERTQDWAEAIKALTPVLDAFPQGYTVNLRLGWLHYLSGQHRAAIDHYRKALQTAPDSVEAKLGLLYPLLAQDKLDVALQVTQQILNADRHNYFGNMRLVEILRREGKWDQAARVSQDMLVLYPTAVPFLVELALAREAQGERASALAIFADVLVLDPENVTAKRFLGTN